MSTTSAAGIARQAVRFTVLITFGLLPTPTMAGPQEGLPVSTAEPASEPGRTDQAAGLVPATEPAGPDRAATPEPAQQPDPALVELDQRLGLLAAGQLPSDIPLDSLFRVGLTDSGAIAARLTALESEIQQLVTARQAAERELANPDQALPPPTPPADPDPEPVAPTAPAITADGGSEDGGAPEEGVEPGEMVAYREAMDRYAQEKGRWDLTQASHLQAVEDHRKASEDHRLKVEAWRKRITASIEDARLKERIAGSRLKILKAWQTALDDLPGPARIALDDLAAPKTALLERATAVRTVIPAVDRLKSRLKSIADRITAGGLLGLRVDRAEAEEQATTTVGRLDEVGKRLTNVADRLTALAVELESQGRGLRRAIMTSLGTADREARIDPLFLEHLDNSRRLAKQTHGSAPVAFDGQKVGLELDARLPHPEKLGTVAEANQEIDETEKALDRLDASLTGLDSGQDRWRHAFEREAVTVLSALASADTREGAYSLSTQFLADLQSDLRQAGDSFLEWAAGRWQAVLGFPTWSATADGGWWLIRLGLALAMLIGLGLLRKRTSGLSMWLVRVIRSKGAFKARVGSLVRWAGLLQAIAPTLALLAVGYVALALVGLDYPEVRFIEAAFFWLTLYYLGRQVLLGLTRRISRGRPALLPASEATVSLLRITYGRLGLFLALVAIASTWGRDLLGAGTLARLVDWVVLLWLAGWAVWAAFVWRKTLGATLSTTGVETGPIARAGRFMQTHRPGVLLSPLAFLVLVILAFVSAVRRLLALGGLFAYLRARALRRLGKKEAETTPDPPPPELPERYVKQFPLYPILGEDEALLLPRDDLLEASLEQIERWKPSGRQGSLVLTGEKGSGKTTLLAMLARKLNDLEVVRYTVSRKRTTEKGLVAEMAPALGLEAAGSVGPLAGQLNKGEPRVVLLDEVHNLFLRTVDGYRAFDALVRLVNFTAERVFWVLAFNSFAWDFLNQSRNRVHYFRKLLSVKPWSTEDLQALIQRRNKTTGMEIEFDPQLLDPDRSGSGDLELIETTEGFFRLLRQVSGGNPRVATHMWLQALKPLSEGRLQLGLLRQDSTQPLSSLDPELLFSLAAICEHENLSVDELRRVLNVSLDFAGFAVRYLSELGFIEPKHTDPKRVTLAPRFYPAVLRSLRSKHLLYERE